MARGRKRKDAPQESGVGSGGGSGRSAIIAPGGGTSTDIANLSRNLGLPTEAVTAIMTCEGKGVRSRRSSAANDGSAAGGVGGAMNPAMMNVWGDFLNEEMPSSMGAVQGSAGDDGVAASAGLASRSAEKSSANDGVASVMAVTSSSGPRIYILPIPPRMRLSTDKDNEDDPYHDIIPTPGLLAQTGTLDSSMPGRVKANSSQELAHELECPTLLFPSTVFSKIKVAHIATSPMACHSVAITTHGTAYGWGRNESAQLGLGHASSVVTVPQELSVPNEEDVKFVGAGVGKYHTILVGSNGLAYACGGNKCGQLGVNSSVEGVEKFRKCLVVGQMKKVGGEDSGEGEDMGDVGVDGGGLSVKIVQVSSIAFSRNFFVNFVVPSFFVRSLSFFLIALFHYRAFSRTRTHRR